MSRVLRWSQRAQEDEPPAQLEGYAYNTSGWAMELPVMFDNQIMNGYTVNTTHHSIVVAKAKREHIEVYRQSRALTARE